MKLIITDNYDQMSRKAANIISAQIILKPTSVLGLATGSSPIGTYKQLVKWFNKDDLDFSEIISVNLDEYVGLGEKDNQSYRYFMNDNLFNHVNIKKENTHVPSGLAADMQVECDNYDKLIAQLGGIDLQLLGIGPNGHIGFNEPADIFCTATNIVKLKESTINANARFFSNISDVPTKAITMGMKAIMSAKKILLVANGESKKEILHKALNGPVTPQIPASILQLHPDVTVVYSKK